MATFADNAGAGTRRTGRSSARAAQRLASHHNGAMGKLSSVTFMWALR
jgi:hypothetical protein